MKLNMVFYAFVASVSLHVQASPTVTQNNMWSSWTNTVINKTSTDVYFGSDALDTSKKYQVRAGGDTYFEQKTPANRMGFIYDWRRNVMFSTVDNNGLGVSTVTSIKWKDNKPEAVADCLTVMTGVGANYGYDLVYTGEHMSFTNIDKNATRVPITNETCKGNLEYAKNRIPGNINK